MKSFMFIIVLLLIKYIKTICKNYFSCMIMIVYNYIAMLALLKQNQLSEKSELVCEERSYIKG